MSTFLAIATPSILTLTYIDDLDDDDDDDDDDGLTLSVVAVGLDMLLFNTVIVLLP